MTTLQANLSFDDQMFRSASGLNNNVAIPTTLVAESRTRPPDPLSDEKVFTRTGKNLVIEAQPSVIQFAGFEVGKTRTLKLRIINISSTNQRVHIINPTTPFFAVRNNKLGKVAPGMAETLYIDFTPQDWRYYYDCVRLHSPGEGLLVPIHAYPIMNPERSFPKIIDFGSLAVGETSTRPVTLECTVPIDFEYEVTVVESHPAFRVSPLRGIVPAHGKTVITAEFRPVSQLTCQSRIRLNISQFDFEPMECLLLGTSSPSSALDSSVAQRRAKTRPPRPKSAQQGRLKDMELVASELTKALPSARFPTPTTEASVDPDERGLDETALAEEEEKDMLSRTMQKLATVSLTQGKSNAEATAEAVEAVFYAERKRAQEKRKRTKKKVSTTVSKDAEQTTAVDGYRLPANLTTTRSVNEVLTQQPGKMKIRDLKTAISNRRKLQEARARGSLGEDEGGEVAATARQVRELAFEQHLRKVAEFERSKDMKWFECLGQALPTAADVDKIREERQYLASTVQDRELDADLKRERAAVESVSMSRATRPKDGPALVSLRGDVVEPTFTEMANANPWLSRQNALRRFRRAAYIVIARRRAADRLRAINQFLNAVSRDPAKLEELVAQQAAEKALEAAGASGGAARGVASTTEEEAIQVAAPDAADDVSLAGFNVASIVSYLTPEKIMLQQSPFYREHDFRENVKVDVPEIVDLEDWEPLPLRVPRHFRLMNYPLSFASPMSDTRVPGDAQRRVPRQGAQNEELGQVACGVVPSDLLDLGTFTPTVAPPRPVPDVLTPIPTPPTVTESKKASVSETTSGHILRSRKRGTRKVAALAGKAPVHPPPVPAARSEGLAVGSQRAMEGEPTVTDVDVVSSEDTVYHLTTTHSQSWRVPPPLSKPRAADVAELQDFESDQLAHAKHIQEGGPPSLSDLLPAPTSDHVHSQYPLPEAPPTSPRTNQTKAREVLGKTRAKQRQVNAGRLHKARKHVTGLA